MATQQVKIKVNNKNQVKFNVQPQKIKFNINTNGRPGEDGKTPVKGTDYYTEADKQEMVNLVLAALPSSEGVSY